MQTRTFLFMLLAAYVQTSKPQIEASVRPADVVANSTVHIGKSMNWTGKQVRISTTMLNGQRVITNRVFVLIDQQGKELWNQVFAVEGNVEQTAEAQKLIGTKDDTAIRRVTGTVSSVGDIEVFIDGKSTTVKGPKLTAAKLDAALPAK